MLGDMDIRRESGSHLAVEHLGSYGVMVKLELALLLYPYNE
jgi:hypothetical protein